MRNILRQVIDRMESYLLADEMVPPYQVNAWRDLLLEYERRLKPELEPIASRKAPDGDD